MIYKKKCELRLSFPNGRPSTARTIVKKKQLTLLGIYVYHITHQQKNVFNLFPIVL